LIKEDKVVVEMTPLTLEVIIPVLVAKLTVLFDITEVVATTPFTVVVSVLPLSDVVKLLIILVKADDIPFTKVAKS
jgi:hypothetical protein